jgi:hypothetical protein
VAATVADYRGALRRLTPPKGYTKKPMSVDAVGQQHAAYKLTAAKNGIPVAVFMVFFRRGNYVVAVQDAGIQYTFDPGETLTLARIVDGRIQKHG